MNDRERQFSQEITSLQLRVDQLAATVAASDQALSSLETQVAAARSVADEANALRLGRKLDLVRRRRSAVGDEIATLQDLIAARRRRGGSTGRN